MKHITIFPSLISADILNLRKVIQSLESHCDGFHIDVMDWHFVPNLTWGPMFVNAFAQITPKPLFVHLMIEKPYEFLDLLTLRPIDTVSFHIEATKNIKLTTNRIIEKKWLASIAINPKTPLSEIFPFLDTINSILLMSVDPGFSGQRFIKHSVDRLIELDNHRKQQKLSFEIVMDGGINKDNIQNLIQHGVDQVGIASGIFSHNNPIETLHTLYKIALFN
ncbi:MAG: ribulose-phosphate 3-epimerase [Candidatus Babeliales bacterium]